MDAFAEVKPLGITKAEIYDFQDQIIGLIADYCAIKAVCPSADPDLKRWFIDLRCY